MTLIFLPLLCFLLVLSLTSAQAPYPPTVPSLTDSFHRVSFLQGFSPSFGPSNIKLVGDGSYATLTLNKSSGSGMTSKNIYNYGFFSAAIKLPPGFTSGVVVAFYLSNSDEFPNKHDEIDIELLGHETRKYWVLQTNMYGNGDVKIGREEKFRLWFDPTRHHHHYSIIWNAHHIVFLVDDVPVREIAKSAVLSSAYPAKPMSLHVTIWDASPWATDGGKSPVDYRYAPFVASFGDVKIGGCVLKNRTGSGPTLCSKAGGISALDPVEGQQFVKLSPQQVTGLQWARKNLMLYSYCTDHSRVKVLPPECYTHM